MSITTLPIQKLLVINAGVLITCTEAWKMLIATGQSYLITTFLISCLCFLLYRHNKKTPAVAALCAVAFILVRASAHQVLRYMDPGNFVLRKESGRTFQND
ncbi:MAG: hypothetical protein Q8918_00375 [Bacteroidota bacterium]|nr:hypothetical protein [Bacteroidota bacterium]MDP4211869.1 hypothetical protein [Bacteroidota bacterium]MDP4248542.1 hypothetical protein [Bacteroidota bacterium]